MIADGGGADEIQDLIVLVTTSQLIDVNLEPRPAREAALAGNHVLGIGQLQIGRWDVIGVAITLPPMVIAEPGDGRRRTGLPRSEELFGAGFLLLKVGQGVKRAWF